MVRRISGFTIIEVTAVLAITGLLAVLILGGIGRSLAQRQYIDAVNQTIDFFRGQYTATESASNDRSPQQTCSDRGVVVNPTGSADGSQPRGTSDCLLLGNIVTSSNGADMTVRQVVATTPIDITAVDPAASNESILLSSGLAAGQTVDTYSVESGARLLDPAASNRGISFALMTVRMPTTGIIVTYVKTGSALLNASPVSLVNASNSRDLKMCIDQSGTLGYSMSPMGVVIEKAATNTTGVQPISAGECTI